MAGNNSIQILRGTNSAIAGSTETLAPGQLLYNETKNTLSCGNIAGTTVVNQSLPVATMSLVGYQTNGSKNTTGISTNKIFEIDGSVYSGHTTPTISSTGGINISALQSLNLLSNDLNFGAGYNQLSISVTPEKIQLSTSRDIPIKFVNTDNSGLLTNSNDVHLSYDVDNSDSTGLYIDGKNWYLRGQSGDTFAELSYDSVGREVVFAPEPGAGVVALNASSATAGIRLSTTSGYSCTLAYNTSYQPTLTFRDAIKYRVITFPQETGTIALTSDLSNYVTLDGIQTITGSKSFSQQVNLNKGAYISPSSDGNASYGINNGAISGTIETFYKAGVIQTGGLTSKYDLTLPSRAGTFALTSDVPKLNGTGTGTGTTFYAPTSAGTSGYALKSNGSGAPSWGEVYSPDNPPPCLTKEYEAQVYGNEKKYWRFAMKSYTDDQYNSGSFLIYVAALYEGRKTALVSCNWKIGGGNFECDLYVLAGDDISQDIGWVSDYVTGANKTAIYFYIRDLTDSPTRDTTWKVVPIANNTKNGEITTFGSYAGFQSYLDGASSWDEVNKATYKKII